MNLSENADDSGILSANLLRSMTILLLSVYVKIHL